MNGKVALDTNIAIGLVSGEVELVQSMRRFPQLALPVVAFGELLYGAYNSRMIEMNLERTHRFAAETDVLAATERTAELYGELKAELRRRGRPIPENDLWIAAIALEHDLPLATRDGHFQAVPNLRLAPIEPRENGSSE